MFLNDMALSCFLADCGAVNCDVSKCCRHVCFFVNPLNWFLLVAVGCCLANPLARVYNLNHLYYACDISFS